MGNTEELMVISRNNEGDEAMTDRELLRQLAEQLERWAKQMEYEGPTDTQVKPQRELATRIYAHLGRSDISMQGTGSRIKQHTRCVIHDVTWPGAMGPPGRIQGEVDLI